MPDDSAGNYTLPPGYLAVTGQTIQASQHNPPLQDLGASMGRRYMRDGRAPLLGNIPMNGFKAVGAAAGTDPNDYVTLSQVQELIAALAVIPTGAIMFLSSSVVPAGWLPLTGQSVLRATFAALWTFAQASGNLAATEGAKTVGQFGPGDGSTTFTLPNLSADSGYFVRPTSSGRTIGTAQADELKSHGHTATFAGNPVPDHTHNLFASSIGGGSGAYVGSTTFNNPFPDVVSKAAGGHTPSGAVTVNAAGGTETRPKNIAYPVLIKT